MQECLGISITDKLIRYAKVKKDNNNFEIDSYGLRFYSNLNETLEQIIQETNSINIPISSEILNERYYYFNIFSMTNKNYAERAIKTEFESYCTENHLNSNVYDGKYIYTKNLDNQDQSRIIYVYDSKTDIAERKSYFDGHKINTLVPLSIALPNLITAEKNKNSMIINIDEKTTITTIVNQSIYNVDIIEDGMKEILDRINEKENSYSKSYEACKNTTIYMMETDYNNVEGNEYLKYIVPTLFKIQEEVQNLKKAYKKIDNIYITGMGAVINNIDLYFKEYFSDSKVEILKPYFLDDQININVKDYIEVNSAIALAMQGLGSGIKTLNFLSKDWKSDIINFLTSDVSTLRINKKQKTKEPKTNKKPKINFENSLKEQLDKVETILLRSVITAIMVIIIYSLVSILVAKQIDNKIAEARNIKDYTVEQLTAATNDDRKIVEKTSDYRTYVTNLENSSSALELRRSRKNQLTTLLYKLVYNIPDEVTLTQISNTERAEENRIAQHIIIQAQSERYEQLAYFKAKLKNANILDDVTSTEGQKDDDYVKITIEGDLKTY